MSCSENLKKEKELTAAISNFKIEVLQNDDKLSSLSLSNIKRQALKEELYKQLRKLSSEEIEAITKMINQAVSNIRKAFSQIFDNLFTFLKNLEVEIEKIERRRTQNVRQRTFQISKHSTHNRLKKARIRNQKPRCSKWANCRNKQTYRNYRNQNRR
ncbi:Uncharacterised protein [Streptococcus pneumoniae]|nr:Uncharacterised protein [Streptococcus pneumoniae]CVZ28270.1 Uncharacterised protein [Streptococcus pneumoniae]